MNLRFDLKEGAASPDEWRCEAVCKEIKETATGPTKQKAKKKAAAQGLERLGETEWPNGDPICALGSRASLSFDKVSGKRQWVCAAALTSRVTRRPSETILTPHKGYGLVDEKRSPDSVIVEML